jgi:ankyrin repeat protein
MRSTDGNNFLGISKIPENQVNDFLEACQDGDISRVNDYTNGGPQAERFANAQDRDEYGDTALVFAVNGGHTEIIRRLIAKGANVNFKDRNEGKTALMFACAKGKEEIVLALTESGAKINVQDHNGYTALGYAIRNKHQDLALGLIEKGANFKVNTGSILALAYRLGYHDIVDKIIDSGQNLNNFYDTSYNPATALIQACRLDDQETVSKLLGAKANINASTFNGETALIEAVRNGNAALVEELVQAGANVNIAPTLEPNSPRWKERHGERTEKQIFFGKLVNDYTHSTKGGYTALMYACEKGQLDIVEKLIAAGANLDEQDNYMGMTALMRASIADKPEIVDRLIKAGADAERKDLNGISALYCAKSSNICKTRLERYVNDNESASRANRLAETKKIVKSTRAKIKSDLPAIFQFLKPLQTAAEAVVDKFRGPRL